MAELISETDIALSEWVGLIPISRVFAIPTGIVSWSIHIVPLDNAAAGDPLITLEYGLGDSFFPINPPSSIPAVINSDSVVTRSDAIDRVRLTVAPALAVPNGGVALPLPSTKSVLLRLFALRG